MKIFKLKNCFGALAVICFSASTSLASARDTEAEETGERASSPPEGSVTGMGDINLYPRRVIIQGRQRTAQVGLFNRTANEGDYEINITEMAMTQDGKLVALENISDQALAQRVRSAKSMIRWSPRRLTLQGSESQTIRLMARPAPDTPPGEYRAHFVAISRPDSTVGGVSIDEAVGGKQAGGIGVTIRPRFGISIPVIVRVGETTLELNIQQPGLVDLPDGRTGLQMVLARSGTRSAYGDLLVYRGNSDEPFLVARGIGIYPEIDSRTVILPIEYNEDVEPITRGERLRIEFIDDDFDPGAQLAEADFTVP